MPHKTTALNRGCGLNSPGKSSQSLVRHGEGMGSYLIQTPGPKRVDVGQSVRSDFTCAGMGEEREGRSKDRRKRRFLTWRGIPRKHATYITHIQDEDEREKKEVKRREQENKRTREERREKSERER
jgi:hypothetical protein